MSEMPSTWPITNTEHGMLVAFGEFLQQEGLLDQLRRVPIAQKTRGLAPQAKLIEWLAGITRHLRLGAGVSGMEHWHATRLNQGARPVARDAVVAHAWGLEGFVHYSGVSRTLHACDARTVAAVEEAITSFSRPYIDRAVHELVRRGLPLTYDLDLTGQAVSSTSTTYPEAAFGSLRVNDQVRLGYQLARVCRSPKPGERIWLAGFHHPGDTVSAGCLKKLVLAAELQTGVRPRRRPELVAQRIRTQQLIIERICRLADQQQTKLDRLRQTQTTLIGKFYHAAQVEKGPISPAKMARLQAQITGWQKRLPRLAEQMTQAQDVLDGHPVRLAEQTAELARLRSWQAQLEAANQANPNPPPHITIRMDAGFAAGENLAWLLEMGYWLETKAANGQTTTALRAGLPRGTEWVKVGDNAEMRLVGERVLRGCRYPLTVAVERFQVGRNVKDATLIRSGSAPSLPVWFAHYNARQTIEAGNKEMKGIFFVQHLTPSIENKTGNSLARMRGGMAAHGRKEFPDDHGSKEIGFNQARHLVGGGGFEPG